MRDAVGVGVRVDGTVAVKEGVLCTALGVGSTCPPCGVEASRVRALAGVIDAVPLWLHAVIVRGRININNRNQRNFLSLRLVKRSRAGILSRKIVRCLKGGSKVF
jgi:hypothetical protein